MRLFHLPKGNLPADFSPAEAPRFVVHEMTAEGLLLRDAELTEFPPATPDPVTGNLRVCASYLFAVEPDPSDSRFVVCQVAQVFVRLPAAEAERPTPDEPLPDAVVVMLD